MVHVYAGPPWVSVAVLAGAFCNFACSCAAAPNGVRLGAQAINRDYKLGGGLWGAKLFFGPDDAVRPRVHGGAAYSRADGVGQIVAGTNLALLLPLVRRFTIGAAPIGVRLVCDMHFQLCRGMWSPAWRLADPARRRDLAGRRRAPAGRGRTRAISAVLGWPVVRLVVRAIRHRRDPPAPNALADWDPPPVADVHAFRSARLTRTVYMAATAISATQNTFAGFGLEWRWDRDVGTAAPGSRRGFSWRLTVAGLTGPRRAAAPPSRRCCAPPCC